MYSLNGKWRIKSKTYDTEGEIPGSVYSALLNSRLIDDPFYRDNEAKTLAITDEDFTFSRKFDYAGDYISPMLIAEGIDTLAEIFVNGKSLAKTNNMHRTYYFGLKDYLVKGENEIKIFFPSYDRFIKEKHRQKPITVGTSATLLGFSYVRKASYMSGWDWGPMLPDAGIWKDIYIIDDEIPRITEFKVTQRHDGGKVYVKAEAFTNKPADVKIRLIAPDKTEQILKSGEEAEVKNPKLWWPNGYGEQNLYEIRFAAERNGKVTDEKTKRIGLRTLFISRDKDEWGEEFCFKVNGIKIFALGADYIPEDNILQRLSKERTSELIEKCKFSNFNSIRVWGGGFYPFDYFFDLCDEAGIIVFMDLMFACASYPYDKEFYDNVKCELEDNLRRIRHHACLGVISGNNEIEEECAWWTDEDKKGYLDFFEGFIPKIVKKECPDISFVTSSPSTHGGFNEPQSESGGDNHYWAVWHGNLPFKEYRNHYFRFLSEFGFQSFPCNKTVEEFTLPEDRNPFSRIMELHQRCPAANGKILSYLSQTYLYPFDFENVIYASQLLQAEAIKYGVEHMRRNRGRCMGSMYWQLNDCWPVASWSSVDGSGRLKALHYEAKRFYEPVHISCLETGEYTTRKEISDERCFDYETKAQLFITKDTLSPLEGEVEWKLCSADGKELQKGVQKVKIEPLSVLKLDEIDFNKTDVRKNYFSFALEADGKIISRGVTLFTKPKHFDFVDPKIKLEVSGDEITVYADALAKYVYIYNENEDLVLSDNYFDTDKGSRTVKILSGNTKGLKVKTVYDIR